MSLTSASEESQKLLENILHRALEFKINIRRSRDLDALAIQKLAALSTRALEM